MCASTLHLSQSHDNHMMCTWYILVFFLSLITSRLEVSILRVINPHFGKVKVCKGSMHSIHCCVLAHTNAVPTDPNLSFSFLDSRTLQSNRIWSVLSTSLVSQSILTTSDQWSLTCQCHWSDTHQHRTWLAHTVHTHTLVCAYTYTAVDRVCLPLQLLTPNSYRSLSTNPQRWRHSTERC